MIHSVKGNALANVYVKVFANRGDGEGGEVSFFIDGYTDICGKF